MVSHFFRGGRGLNLLLIMLFLFLDCSLPAAAAVDDNHVVEEWVRVAGYGEDKLSTVLVTGTVLCRPCSDNNREHQLQATPVSGASIAVSCGINGKSRRSNWIRGSTDKYGDFVVDIPSHLHAIPNLDKVCLVKVIQVPKASVCNPGFTGKHRGIRLSSIGDGVRTYTTQKIHLMPKPSSKGCISRL